MRLVTMVLNFIKSFFGVLVTQDFKPEDYNYFCTIPFTACDIWFKGIRPVIRYRGEKWARNRNDYMIERHGMTFEDTQKAENAHLFVAKLIY